jgi:hypothetical protein
MMTNRSAMNAAVSQTAGANDTISSFNQRLSVKYYQF